MQKNQSLSQDIFLVAMQFCINNYRDYTIEKNRDLEIVATCTMTWAGLISLVKMDRIKLVEAQFPYNERIAKSYHSIFTIIDKNLRSEINDKKYKMEIFFVIDYFKHPPTYKNCKYLQRFMSGEISRLKFEELFMAELPVLIV